MTRATLTTIVKECDTLLRTAAIGDYDGAVNGLQVQNSGVVTRIAGTIGDIPIGGIVRIRQRIVQ